MIAKSHRWKITAMAAAALLGLSATNATALSLGRITVQSALGEPLRAEIDVPVINTEEAASLKAVAAAPEAFRAAGLEYNPALASLQATLLRRADGRAYLRLSSERAINDPFLDMILVASWGTGRIVRDYTMLFDPPSLRKAAPIAPTPAQVPAPTAVRTAPAPESMPSPAPVRVVTPAAEPAKVTPKAPAQTKREPVEDKQVTVKAGDTAGRIAASTKPASVSLDQMLVAMLRANPTAFLDDNVNRVKAGAVLDIPTAEQAGATPAAEARQIIVAQSKDFNDFRRKLAGSAPDTKVAAADRKTSGSVQATVEDKKPVVTPDKLTLSKGAVQGLSAEDKLAQERNAKEAASRVAELEKNISDLGKLGAASSTVAQSAGTPQTPVDSATSTAPVASPQAASEPASATATPAPAITAAVTPPTVEPIAPSGPSFVDELVDNPLAPAGAVGLIALLAGLGIYRARRNKKASQVDSVFLESRLQPDSFFGASGGQSIDTSDSASAGTSMVYTPSQLDAVDDVDPVAEADVYLAYGRDLQAEEILRDALRSNPARIAIHQKLLEIFAKRRDTKAFQEVSTLAFKLTNGKGADWERICELGLSIDPDNAFYQPGGQPDNLDGTPSRPAELDIATMPVANFDNSPSHALEPKAGGPVDLDLDLDFSLDEEPAGTITETPVRAAEPTLDLQISDSMPAALDLDFGMDTGADELAATPSAEPVASAEPVTSPVDFLVASTEIDAPQEISLQIPDNEDFKQQAATSFGATGPAPLPDAKPEATAPPDLSMLEFDLGSLSLDLETPAEKDTEASDVQEDPLETKLALADEFIAIGDDDGARALIEEVISEATGEMKIKAQRALSNL